jgi:hypothetical protein
MTETIAVETEHGLYTVDVETEEVEGLEAGARIRRPPAVNTALPRVVATAASGSTVVAVVHARPPLVVSYDAGRTWNEAGAGLPAGRAVAIHADDPDLIVYAARNRLYLSRDGGRFWRALAPELPVIDAVAFDG